jgi:hypothetical protein
VPTVFVFVSFSLLGFVSCWWFEFLFRSKLKFRARCPSFLLQVSESDETALSRPSFFLSADSIVLFFYVLFFYFILGLSM